MNKRYLKKAPPVLSRQQGLIANNCFEEAETELLLHEKCTRRRKRHERRAEGAQVRG